MSCRSCCTQNRVNHTPFPEAGECSACDQQAEKHLATLEGGVFVAQMKGDGIGHSMTVFATAEGAEAYLLDKMDANGLPWKAHGRPEAVSFRVKQGDISTHHAWVTHFAVR